jgi:hypothetical protein
MENLMKKKIMILMLASMNVSLLAMDVPGGAFDPMEIDEVPELVRVKPRIVDIVLLQALQKGYYCAASEMINAGIGRSLLTVAELQKPIVAERVMWGAFQESHPDTINALIAVNALPKEKWQEVFERFAGYIMVKDAQKALPMLLNSHAIRFIDLNRQFKYGMSRMETALCVAADFSLPKMVQLLLNAGADVNARDTDDMGHESTPIMCAVSHRLYHDKASDEKDQQEVIKLLLACPNINLELKEKFGLTILLEAIVFRKMAAIPELLAKTIDINVQDRLGRSALMLALWRDNAKAARSLIERGADLNLKDFASATALEYAKKSHATEIRALIPLIEARISEQAEMNK